MFVLLLIVPLLCGCRFVKEDKDIFCLSTTKSLKGLFAAGVVLHHLYTYFPEQFPSLAVYKNLGFIMVSGFFLISGYGLAYGILHKEHYLRGFFRKRMLPIIIGYYITAFCYYLLYKKYHMLNSNSLFELITGINYWFIIAILVLYIGFFLSFRWLKPKAGLILCTMWTLAYMVFMFKLSHLYPYTYGFWWFNSVLAFTAGIWFSFYRSRIIAAFRRGYALRLIIAAVIFAAAYYLAGAQSSSTPFTLALQLIASVSFCAVVILLSIKFKVNSFVLRNLGTISLELYLVQALWIYLIGNEVTTKPEVLLHIAEIIIGSILMAYAVHYLQRLITWILSKALSLTSGGNKKSPPV